MSGTVEITSNEGGVVEGSFDANFEKSGHVTATFRIAGCAPLAYGDDDGTVMCLL